MDQKTRSRILEVVLVGVKLGDQGKFNSHLYLKANNMIPLIQSTSMLYKYILLLIFLKILSKNMDCFFIFLKVKITVRRISKLLTRTQIHDFISMILIQLKMLVVYVCLNISIRNWHYLAVFYQIWILMTTLSKLWINVLGI